MSEKNRKGRDRVREIIAVFVKHGVKEGVKSINNPVQIRMALEELGPTFIKIGQVLSTRPDILPEPFIIEFRKLQDDVRPEEFETIEKVIEEELKEPVDKLFLSFDRKPLACASLAEVHTAVLKTGERVVVKIQRPKAKDTMVSDIAILRKLARLIQLTPQGNVLNMGEMVDELWFAIRKELDFLNEAENIKKFYADNSEVKFLTCPTVYDRYTTSNVLVMDYIDGVKIAETERLDELGYDLKDIAAKLANNYFRQIFEHGFFHGDPHPGNILISGNRIAYIDFGMMGTLSSKLRDKLNSFLYGVATRDIDAMNRAILQIGIKKGKVDAKKLHSDVEEIYNNYIEVSLYDLDLPQMLDEVFKACRRNNIAMPREVTMLLKGIMTIEGVVAMLDPEMNIIDAAVPYVKSHMLKKSDYRQDMAEQLENLHVLSKSGLKIPVKLLELMNSALAGKLKVQMEHTNLEKSIGELNRMVNRIVFGLLVSALIMGSSMVMNANVGPRVFEVSAFGFIGYFTAVILGFWLLISILRSGKM